MGGLRKRGGLKDWWVGWGSGGKRIGGWVGEGGVKGLVGGLEKG